MSTYTLFNIHERWFNLNTLDNIQELLFDTCIFDIFNYSVPNIKLYYPEPFIATPSYIHDDFWFIHITIYQYWLWFFFISLIVFFFISFLVAVRWNNIRFRPSRETRGVSRSKCGDLITATVPVSWASSIIIHESTDAIEFYDGFGSTEMAIGIRAYQWGWEYYYPRNTDLLNWNDTKTLYIGKSIKYPNNNWDEINQNFFKNYNHLANMNQTNALPLYLWSNWNLTNSQLLKNSSFASNRLINNSTTLLITTPKVLNISTYFNKTINSWFNNSYMLYKKFLFTSIHTPQTTIIWNQFLVSNAYMLYNVLLDSSIMQNINYFIEYTSLKPSEWIIWFNKTVVNSQIKLLQSDFPTLKYNLQSVFEFNTAINNVLKWEYEHHIWSQLKTYKGLVFNLYAEQDFKQWSSFELLEDTIWDFFINHKFFYKYFDVFNLSALNYIQLNDNLLNLNQVESRFFQDFSLIENTYSYNYIISSIWTFNQYSKLTFLNLSTFLWVNESLINSFHRFKTNQFLVWFLNNNNFWYFSINYKLLTVYELLFNYFLTTSMIWVNSTSSNLISNGVSAKNIVWSLPTNWVVSSKLFNTGNNSFWKIFKSSFQDERTLFNFKIFSNSYITMPYNTNQLLLLNSIQKNSSIFYAPLVMRNYLFTDSSLLNLNILWKNFTFFFPFLTSTDSDIMRYIWFDWYTVRSSVITKSIDTSLYNLHGTLNYNYNFTKQPSIALVNKTDNFFIKYMHARKLYIPLYIYSPYYFHKTFKMNFFNDLMIGASLNNTFWNVQINLLLLSYWLDMNFINLNNWIYFNNNLSFISTHNHPFSLITALTNTVDYLTQLNDILVKRNYLLSYLNTQLGVFYLPLSYQLTMWNPLIQLVKTTNLVINSANLNYSNNLNQSLTLVLKTYLNNYSNLNSYLNRQVEIDALKNPYQPLRKGVTNMIRVHADKAIAMPIDTRLQILAVSRDIIHSWAIPSAGIKIDCIPGYSSHRITFFLLSGIYWGQCMEICGRFHHWMPIVVYFIRRDLFCIWCIHFIFTNKQLNMINQSFETYNNYLSSNVSLSSNYWLYEL